MPVDQGHSQDSWPETHCKRLAITQGISVVFEHTHDRRMNPDSLFKRESPCLLAVLAGSLVDVVIRALLRRRVRGPNILQIIHGRLRPAVRIPTQRHYCQGGFSIHSKVALEVRREPILSLRVQCPRMSRADQRTVGSCQKKTAAAVQHVHTRFVQIWTSD